jgi:GNAT superfamily N-acetyltransferase
MNETTTQAPTMAAPSVPVGQGRWVSIRPIERSDASRLSDFYGRLSGESRRRRFLGPTPVLAPELLRRFTAEGEGLVGVLFEHGPRDGAIVAHASVQPVAEGEAEIAFAVADELQGRGLGRTLMREALDLARARGHDRATATLLADNAPMRRLIVGAGRPVITDDLEAGIEEITVGLDAAA